MCQQTPISQEVGYKCFVAVDFTGVVINFKTKNDDRKIKNEKKNSQINKKNRISILENIKLYVKLMYNYQHQLSADFADAAGSEISSRRKKKKERNE